MSKGSMLLGYASGKVGSLVFARRNGEQITRPYVAQVRNPKTRAQMNQRVKWPNLVAMWRLLKPYIEMGMQDKKTTQSDYNSFISRNIGTNQAYLLKEEVAQGACLAAPYILTSGSLGLCAMDTVKNSAIRVGNGLTVSGSSIGQVSASIIANNANFAVGDQITFVILGQVLSAGVPSVVPCAYKFVLTETSDNTPFEFACAVYGDVVPSMSGGLLGWDWNDATFQGYGAACIHSRVASSGLLELSTSAMTVFFSDDTPLGQSTPFGVSLQEAVDSYGCNEGVFLDPKTIDAALSLSSSISSVEYSGGTIEDEEQLVIPMNSTVKYTVKGVGFINGGLTVSLGGSPVEVNLVSDEVAEFSIRVANTSMQAVVVTATRGYFTFIVQGGNL